MPPQLRTPGHAPRRATVVGAGSFGTAVALLLERAGVRTTLLCRTAEQARAIEEDGENTHYLPGVEIPAGLRVRVFGAEADQFHRVDLVFLAVPSKGIGQALADLSARGVEQTAGIVSLAKGLIPPEGTPPSVALERAFGPARTACVAGPAHAREMVESGAGLVCASHAETLAHRVAELFQRAGVVCEVSDDPVGAELAGVA
jgi:glycerol-3-phosphate dehydrogenase (NAD(P)+)